MVLIAAGVGASGRRTAVIGTMGTWIDGEQVATAFATLVHRGGTA